MTTALSGINLNRLVVFVAVVEIGSLTGAASRLGLAKTMVSTHMQRLEAELGSSLLIRTTRRLALTEAGERFYEAARAILQSAEEAINSISQDVTQLKGILKVTAPVDYGASIIAPLAVELRRQHPGLRVELVFGDRLFDLVGEGIDVAIRVGKLADSSYQAVRLATLERWLVAPPDLLGKIKKPSTPQDLVTLPHVALSVLAQPLTWTFEGPNKARQTVQFQAGVSANTGQAVRSAVIAGGGLAILPEFAVAEDIANGHLIRVLPKWSVPSGGVFAVFPQARFRPQKVRVLIDALRAKLK